MPVGGAVGRHILPQAAIVADDFTGAADAAGRFAALGLSVTVISDPVRVTEVDVVSISSGSRDLPEDEAVVQTRAAVEAIRQPTQEGAPFWVYKKIDSTLRGHPGAELAAAMDALGTSRALVAPAFPAQGRTTVGGRLLLHGLPLEDASFGAPVGGSDLCHLLARYFRHRPVWHVPLEAVRAGPDAIRSMIAPEHGVYVADAESDEDLDTLARVAIECGVRLLCGSAGLARSLATNACLRPAALPPDWPPANTGPIVVVAGSLHPATTRQVADARGRGAAVVRLSEPLGESGADILQNICDNAARLLANGVDVILTTAGGAARHIQPRFSEHLAAVVGRLTRAAAVGGLVLTGGDTAVATLHAIGCSAVSLLGEIEAGIPWGRLCNGSLRGLPVVTKAGGFGAVGALTRSISHLRSWDA